jgi:two-component sensor histidine kinase
MAIELSKEEQAYLKEKEVLLREIYHRTKNNMQVMISLLRIQSANIEDKQVAEMFKESRDRIRSMALVHEKLYQNKGLADVDFKGYVKSLVNSIFSSYGVNAAGITSITETDNVSIGLETAIPCGLIINELVSNSLKYAFPGNRKGEISVALRSFDEDALVLEVGDNGIGMPEDLDFRNTASMGLHLVNILSEDQLHGKIELDRTGETTFRIRFKNHKYEARI